MLEEIDSMGTQLEPWELDLVTSLLELNKSSEPLSLTGPQMYKISNIHSRRVM